MVPQSTTEDRLARLTAHWSQIQPLHTEALNPSFMIFSCFEIFV
jgi:hypothetical protein